MCIVSIFSASKDEFILTQNRDESYLRPTSNEIVSREVNNQIYRGPMDLISGGTWIYYSESFVACILNGAYEKHSHQPPYKLSRGLIVLELLKHSSIDQFISKIDLDGIEPFSMIMLNRKSEEKKILVWDETTKHTEDLSGQQLIVRSSSTLYSEKEKAFHQKSIEAIQNIHPEAIFDVQHQLRMLANEQFPSVQTTSITQIIQQQNRIELKFCQI